MTRHSTYCIVLLLMSLLCSSCKESNEPVRIIFDTDFGGDADDLGALAMINHFQNKGEVDCMAVMCWNLEKYAVSSIDAVNTYYGNPSIPVATRSGETHETFWNHSKSIASQLPHQKNQKNVPKTTELYRKILSESDDHSIVIVTVGPLANIQYLIESQADSYSPLSGKELIHQKVKEFVIMGGNFPTSEDEWNFNGDMPGVTKFVLENLNLPITFSGAELGASIKTGEVFNELPKDAPLFLGFYHFSQHAPWVKDQFNRRIFDNATFDQTAVLYAVRNGVGLYWDKVSDGMCLADENGGNTWEPKAHSKHSYLVLKMPKSEIETEIENFMLGNF